MDKAVPNWESLTVKSKKWGEDGSATSISATLTVESDGGISVSYAPKKFAEYMGRNSIKSE